MLCPGIDFYINKHMSNTENIIKSFAKKSTKPEKYVKHLWDEIHESLIKEGLLIDDKRFFPYLTTRLKKQLKIKESIQVFKRFKEFMKEERNET